MSTSYLLQDNTYQPSFSDPDNRDPHNINKHLKLDFANVVAEPDISSYNFEILHKLSRQVYHYSKVSIYRFLAIVVGLPLMLFWGLLFGIYSFVMIWIAVPMRRITQSGIGEAGHYVQSISDAIIAPVHRSMGQIFSGIRINLTKEEHFIQKTVQV